MNQIFKALVITIIALITSGSVFEASAANSHKTSTKAENDPSDSSSGASGATG